jgi:hypothetical protein
LFVISLGVASMLGTFGYLKVTGSAGELAAFRHWGFPDWFRVLVGAMELVGATLLLIRSVAWTGAALLAGAMLGAIHTQFTKGGGHGLLPHAVLAVVVVLGLVRRPRWLRRGASAASVTSLRGWLAP